MSASDNLHPQQLKMFMSPKEITAQYQPLDADREGKLASRAGAWTDRTGTTGGHTNWDYREYPLRGSRPPYMRPDREVPETDDDVWSRKSQEAQMSPRDYYEHLHGESPRNESFDYEAAPYHASYPQVATSYRNTDTAQESFEGHEASYLERKVAEHEGNFESRFSGPSIWDSVRQSGVQNPVHLGMQFGSQGKPQVVGGHHRIASAMETRPNDLIPVLHSPNIRAARNSPYKYT